MRSMVAYLTRKYDTGDGPLFGKTPLEYAELLGLSDVVAYLKETLAKYAQAKNSAEAAAANKGRREGVESDRVAQARTRLKDFNAAKK